MDNITYLLGAGASANCIPVVKAMGQEIENTAQRFLGTCFRYNNFPDSSEKENHNNKVLEIQKDLLWLAKICKTHYSVDTYAKKLYIKEENEELLKLKKILSIYFTIQQKLTLPDKRYDNFWASILDYKDSFPKQLRIISWNYDSQLELSYRNFISSSVSMEEAYGRIRMASFHGNERATDFDGFAIFKLNGSARMLKKREGRNYASYLVDNFTFEDNTDFFEKLYQSYRALQYDPMKTKDESFHSELSFAWEHNFDFEYYKNLKASIADTTVLVVIGYSFPFFNRKLDKLIINDYMPNLRKVYFQAPDAENLQERFLAITNKISVKEMVLTKDENQFTFPNELDI